MSIFSWEYLIGHGEQRFFKGNQLDYDGEWFADKRTGQGTMYDKEGVVYSGLWLNDMPDETLKRKNSDDEEIIEAEANISTKKRRRH